MYIAGGGWSAANLQATINGVANSVTIEGAGLRCLDCANYFDRKYNEIDVSWDGGTAKVIIYCPLKTDPETSATESQSQTESQSETQTETTTEGETTTKTPTVLPDWDTLQWTEVSGMYTDLAYCVVDHTITGWGNMNFYGVNYMQFVGSEDSKFNEATLEVLDSSGDDVTSRLVWSDKAAAIYGVMVSQLGTTDEYYLFTVDNPNTGYVQVAVRVGNPGGGETSSHEPQKPLAPTGLTWAGNDNLPYYFAWGASQSGPDHYNFYVGDTKVGETNGTAYNADGFFDDAAPGPYTVKVTAVKDELESDPATLNWTKPYPEGWYDVATYKSTTSYTYPLKDGKVFAGWFTDDTCTTPYTSTTGYAYAKFIDENVLSTKFQASNDGTAVRMLSSLDSKDYSQIGFNFTGTYDGDELDNWTKTATKIYKKINADGTEVEPTIFSSESKYFFTYTVRGLTEGKSLTLSVTPFFVTLDGTTVTGKSGTYPQS